MDSSMEFMANYETYKKNYLGLKNDYEIMKQELHECKRSLIIMKSTQEDYKNEIDMLQSQEIEQKQKYQEIIKQMVQTTNDMRESHNEEKLTLENIIMGMEEKNEQLKADLEAYKGCNNVTKFNGDASSLIHEIWSSEPPEFYENQELKQKLKELADTNEILNKKVQDYTKELENLKESFEYKRHELAEAKTNNQFLTDENMCMREELESLKSQPLNNDSKGNSLFAEVDDRRVYLQDKINKMKLSYITLTQEKNQLQNNVHHLKIENLRLLEKWNSDIAEIDNDDREMVFALRSRIKILENLNEKYKKELSEKPWIISKKSFEEIEYFEMTLDEKNNEIKSLRDQVVQHSLDRLSLTKDLTQAKKEKRKWELAATTKQNELELLIIEKNTSINEQQSIDVKFENEKDSRNSLKDSKSKEENLEIMKRTPLKENVSDIYEETNLIEYSNSENIIKQDSFSKPKDEIRADNIYADKENMSKKVTFSENSASPTNNTKRKGTIVYKPPVKL